MWSTISNVYRTSIPLCHACRHQAHFNRHYVAIHTQRSNKFSCWLKLESATAYFKFISEQTWKSGKLDVAIRSQGHLNGMEIVERQDSTGRQTDTPNTKETCIQSKTAFENKDQKFICALHRARYEHISKLHSQTCNIINTWLFDKSDLKMVEEENRKVNILKCLTAFQRRKCTFRVSSIKPCKYNLFNGLIPVSGKLLNRKTKYCYATECSFHTSAENGVHTVIREAVLDSSLPGEYCSLYRISRGTLVESLEVVTVKEQRAVRALAERVQLKIHEWPVAIETEKYDVGVLVSFGHLIPDAVIHMFPYGILNMHPSLLPRWRGASPVIHTVLNGDDVTGVSVMEIRPKHFDIGPILLQRKCQVPQRCTSFQLADILGSFGASMMLECLKDLLTLERLEHEQDRSGITYAHKLKHKNANIDWENSTAEEIDCQYRAISELIPLKTEMNEHTLKLFDVVDPCLLQEIDNRDVRGYHGDIISAEPGTVVYHKHLKCIVVKCKIGLIGFRKVVFRRRLTGLDFFNGYINKNTCTKFTSLDNDLNKYIKVEKIPVKSKA
ncbi:uncharacterized protein LOC128550579 [Mercenaria mercenaria]|uniref:uncharacterized protein LOC128550579 n=1 Tax=Mercenaria mercenaria TaxID=6596 RepID=UPI00234F168B|nr:uncharacterized protein LOC128550579 [Mercenaria mercenaria]